MWVASSRRRELKRYAVYERQENNTVASSRRRELKLQRLRDCVNEHAVASSRRRELKPQQSLYSFQAFRGRLLTEA